MVKIKNYEQIIETTGEILMVHEYPTQPPWVTESIPGTNSDEVDTNTRNHISSCEMNDLSNQIMDGNLNQVRNEDARENKIYATITNINGTDLMDIPQQNSEAITTQEAKRKIMKHIDNIWQRQWNESTK